MTTKQAIRCGILGLVVAVGIPALLRGQTAQSAETVSLEQGFRQPPDSAKPFAWWHWMSGNVTEAGHYGRSGVDAPGGHWRDADVRRRYGRAAVCGQASDLDDAGVEVGLAPCGSRGGPPAHGDGHGRFRRMERDGRPLGEAGTGNEEICVERDGGGGPALQRQIEPAAVGAGQVPGFDVCATERR